MAFEFKFPDVGEGLTEGDIVKWHIKEGDMIKKDQVIAEVETAKAVVEIPSPKAGKVLKLYYKVGETVKVGEVLLSIDTGQDEPQEEKSMAEKAGGVVGFIEEADEKKVVKSV